MTHAHQPAIPQVFFLDFDNVLLDVPRLKRHAITPALNQLFTKLDPATAPANLQRFWQLYRQIPQERGRFIPLADLLAQIGSAMQLPTLTPALNELFLALPFQDYVFPQVGETLTYLGKLARLVLISVNDPDYGHTKITASGLARYFDELQLCESKPVALAKLVKRYPDHQLSMVDDQLAHLQALASLAPQATTYWVHQALPAPTTPEFAPTFTVASFSQLPNIINKRE